MKRLTMLQWYQADFFQDIIKTQCISCQIRGGGVQDVCNQCGKKL